MSVETVHADLRAAIRQRLISMTGIPDADHIAWEGWAYKPVVGQPFMREALRPLGSKVRALGRGGTIAHKVTSNLTLVYPAGKGTLEIEAAAGRLLAGFAPGGPSLVYGSTAGSIQEAERLALLQEPDWLTLPVVITITAYTAN